MQYVKALFFHALEGNTNTNSLWHGLPLQWSERMLAEAGRSKKLLVAPGLTTSNKKLLGTKGIATNGAVGRY